MPARRGTFYLAFSLLLALAPLSGLAAEPSAAPLRPEQSGQLTGDRGGAFVYYRFTYAGGASVTLELQVRPPNASGVGLRLYGPHGEVAGGNATEPGDYLLQVYNYQPGLVADYTLIARGLPAQPAPPPPAPPSPGAPSAEPSPTASPEEAGPQAPLAGVLPPGGRDGQFALFEFDYPGDGSVYTVKLQLSPERSDVLQHAGFRLYGPSGRLYVTGGAQPGLRPNVAGDFSSHDPGTYTLQLYNYGDVAVSYEVSLQAR